MSGTNLRPSEARTVYDSPTQSSIEHTVRTSNVPVTPIGLEALRTAQIDVVIDRLTGENQPLPVPFSKPELYRIGADVGIPVWDPEQKAAFTERVLDRLDYTWDADSSAFVPVSGKELVENIKTAADTILPHLMGELPPSLRAGVGEWCDTHGLDSLGSETARLVVSRQAVFNVFLKAVLYEQYHRRGEVPALTGDSRAVIRQARNLTGDPVFDQFILDQFVCLAERKDVEAVVDERHRLLYSSQPAEDLGSMYESLIPKKERRTLGQHRTPPEHGTLLRTWAADGNDTVLDPGTGAGGLSTPFHPRWSVSTDSGHVVGVDCSPLALCMGTTAQRLAGQPHEVVAEDFLSVSPDDLHEDVDAVVCNPPYTRHHDLPKDYKEALNRRFEAETGRPISAASPLYAYICYHIRQFLDTGDRAAILTPQNWLATKYGEPLKQFLLDEFEIRALVQFDPAGESIFDTAQTTTLIALLEATDRVETAGTTRFIRVDEWTDTALIRDAVNNGEQGSTDWGFVNCVEQAQLSPCRNWQALFSPHGVDTGALTPLGDLVTVHRGSTTGSVDFFCLSQEDVEATGLDERHLSRLVRRPMYIDGCDFRDEDWKELRSDEKDVWLFDPDEVRTIPASAEAFRDQVTGRNDSEIDYEEDELGGVLAYLETGMTEYGLHDVDCLDDRPHWYRPRREPPRQVLVENASRDGFRFILNETDARHINNLFAFADVTLDEPELKALLAFLNSSLFELVVRDYKKTRDGGFDAISPNDLESVPVLDPTTLRGEVVTQLAGLFDELRETARQGDDCTQVNERIMSVIGSEVEVH